MASRKGRSPVPQHRRVVRATAGLVAALVLLPVTAGCDDLEDRSGEAILRAALDDMGSLRSVRIAASLEAGPAADEVSVDLSVTDGGRCAGTLTVGNESARLLGDDGDFYLEGAVPFWDGLLGDGNGQLVEDYLQGRWAKLPAASAGPQDAEGAALAGLTEVCELDGLLDVVRDEIGSAPTKDGSRDEDGTRVLTLTSADGDSSVTISADEPHHIRELTSSADGSSRSWSFRDFDEPVDLDVPDPADVAALTELGTG